ncbi:sigma-70 family RNA polymerase sigma factor [Albibacterium sp.]|uniref:sigma-70 family RNA polymerase sigma factor n=1 Tax=Albibacterium sp. TaxID=2952885 RepID=UPI002CC1F434|nr:sigma-70 family RNA polymerase sigma factor [Albibacterium sp.]HUH18522.1 sigma-70 family RNA polymerase sigma factor [Albibacterium sp.]
MNNIKQFDQYDDLEIVSRVLLGEVALYEIIIRRYNSYLFRIGRTYAYNHADTEDLMQETYLSAYSNLSKFENRSSFKTWLVKIMLNHCYHRKQKFSFQKEVMTESFEQETAIPMFVNQNNDTDRTIVNKELGRVLENALQQIPEDYRIVFSLRELNGMSTNETSEALSISESNVKVRLSRAKSMLRFEVEKMYSPADIFEFNLIYCDKIVENVMRRIGEML